jgi:hypothetical protein
LWLRWGQAPPVDRQDWVPPGEYEVWRIARG